MGSNGSVAILLATYNGEKFLDEQILSLLSQSYRDFVVIARDDNSSDRTPEILGRWSAANPDKFKVVSDNLGNLRSAGNFSRLMQVCDAPFFAFCDQDDVWLPNKLERMICEIRRLEKQFGSNTPILVHSDLTIIDENSAKVSASFCNYMHMHVRRGRQLDHLLFDNVVTGCASMGNRALLELGRPIPDRVNDHDWWLAQVAASCGALTTIPEATVLYRQHGGNLVGTGWRRRQATLWDVCYFLRHPGLLKMRMAEAMLSAQAQARVLLRATEDRMPRRNREFLHAFCLPQQRDEVAPLPWARRTWLCVRFLITYLRALPLAFRSVLLCPK